MIGFRRLVRTALFAGALIGVATAARSANPIAAGWYADPEIRIFDHRYWIYPTTSDVDGPAPSPPPLNAVQRAVRAQRQVRPSYLRQTAFDAFSSPDLVHWTRHADVFDVTRSSWAADALWAPSAIEANGRYYLFFGANDPQDDSQLGGVGVAVADRPGGPFRDLLGRPLVGAYHHGAQPIDPFVFRDDDGAIYLFYGGHDHCNVARLGADLRSVVPLPDGKMFREVTPPGYVEGVFMIKRRGVYYLMWSEGDWTGPDYRVAYAMGRSALGPFTPAGVILRQDPQVALGAGHHSVVNVPGTDDWYIVYHRRPLGDGRGEHRQIAIDRMRFNADGTIAPVRQTVAGVVEPRPLP